MIASVTRVAVALSLALLGFVLLISSTVQASAAALGLEAACPFSTATHAQCNFPVLVGAYDAEINYYTVQCNSTGATAYNIQQAQILAIPPNGAADVAYQVAGNRASVVGVANAAGIVNIRLKKGTVSSITIDLSIAPGGTTSCSASITALF